MSCIRISLLKSIIEDIWTYTKLFFTEPIKSQEVSHPQSLMIRRGLQNSDRERTEFMYGNLPPITEKMEVSPELNLSSIRIEEPQSEEANFVIV